MQGEVVMKTRRFLVAVPVLSIVAVVALAAPEAYTQTQKYDIWWTHESIDFTAGPFGHSENKVYHHACENTPAFGADTFVGCELDGNVGNHCSVESASTGPNDCSCKVHIGAPAFQKVQCAVRAHAKTRRNTGNR
jgi:hypothetical protein